MLCNKYKIIFVHIPKTGGTSIEHAFSDDTFSDFSNPMSSGYMAQLINPRMKQMKRSTISRLSFSDKNKHWDVKKYSEEESEDIFNSYFKFSFVRNPWARVYSMFIFLRKPNSIFQKKSKEEQFLAFNNYVRSKKLCKFSNQFDWLSIDNKLVVDEIYRFENLQKDFDKLCNKIGKDKIKLPHFYNSETKSNYVDVYNDETREIIGEYFLKDIKKFNYKFGE